MNNSSFHQLAFQELTSRVLKHQKLKSETPNFEVSSSKASNPVVHFFATQSFQIKELSNPELHASLKSFAARERKITHIVLLHIMELDNRKLYAEMAYSSLWEYLVEEIGYSSPAAQSRIDAARLMVQVPDLGQKIESGSMNLSQVGVLQKTFRQIKRITKVSVSADQKQKIVEKLENKTARETEVFLAKTFDLPVLVNEKVKIQKDESTRYEITFSKEEAEILNQAQGLLSHALMRAPYQEISFKNMMLYCAKKVIQQKTGVKL